MADITPERINIQEEETDYKAAVSEALLKRTGAGINFINLRQYDTKQFFVNGRYDKVSGAQTEVDGAQMMLFDAEIVGVMMFNMVAGSSGTTTLDINRWTASNTGGTSIFTIKPSITSAAGNIAFVAYDFLNSTTLENPAGTTLPTLAVTNLNAGDLLTLDIDAKQVAGENCGLVIYYRPR